MAVKVFLLVVVAVVSRAGSQDLQIPGFTAYKQAGPVEEINLLLETALNIHAEFINFFSAIAPTRYTWGYQLTDPTSGEIRSLYESRYGGLTYGSYTVLRTDNTGITLYYSVDDVSRSISGLRMERTVGGFQVPVASSKNKPNRAAVIIQDDPLAVLAARSNEFFVRYHNNPTRYRVELELQNPVTGDKLSQYQSRYDNTPRGSFTLAKPDGSSRTIYYSIDEKNKLTVYRAEMTGATVASPTHYNPIARLGNPVFTSLVF